MPEKKIDPRIGVLVRKWQSGQISEAEKAELEQWYNSFDDSLLTEDGSESVDALRQRLYLQILERSDITAPPGDDAPSFETQIEEDTTPTIRPHWPRLAAAASLIVVLSGAAYLIVHKQQQPQTITRATTHDLAPGGNKAILTLANGSRIVLDSAHNGLLTQQQDIAIEKTADGSLRYTSNTAAANAAASGTAAANAAGANTGTNAASGTGVSNSTGVNASELYNTISTPKGGQYAVTLADGTKVILNAASSLRYPASFTGKDRSVQLSGEGWFEVAQDKQHPFIVISGQQEVKVLGTQFNLNAYDDEPGIKTTLVTGSVIVSSRSTHQSHSLSPGQQCLLTNTNLSISTADTEEATSWKNGYFMFESEDITSIMRKIARWYDVEVKFEGTRPSDKFNGTVHRFVNVSQVLKKLELTNKVHFNIEGRTIVVSK
ncbi:MAG TPA: FecR domain-containing protein [Puia sp.]|nr:FecR domain-containing protein [Puia sp.]